MRTRETATARERTVASTRSTRRTARVTMGDVFARRADHPFSHSVISAPSVRPSRHGLGAVSTVAPYSANSLAGAALLRPDRPVPG